MDFEATVLATRPDDLRFFYRRKSNNNNLAPGHTGETCVGSSTALNSPITGDAAAVCNDYTETNLFQLAAGLNLAGIAKATTAYFGRRIDQTSGQFFAENTSAPPFYQFTFSTRYQAAVHTSLGLTEYAGFNHWNTADDWYFFVQVFDGTQASGVDRWRIYCVKCGDAFPVNIVTGLSTLGTTLAPQDTAFTFTFHGITSKYRLAEPMLWMGNAASNAALSFDELKAIYDSRTEAAGSNPNVPTALVQRDGADASIPAGTRLDYAAAPLNVKLECAVSDNDAADTVGADFEVRLVGSAFTGTPNYSGTLAAPNPRTVTRTIADLAGGSYKWQARSISSQGTPSAWVKFNADAECFRLNTIPALGGVDISVQGGGAATTNKTLVATRTGRTDPDAGAVEADRYKWSRQIGGAGGWVTLRDWTRIDQDAGADKWDLAAAGDAGDNIKVEVEAFDTYVAGNQVSAVQLVANTAPVMVSIAITPDPPGTNAIATANRAATDADNDTLTFEYQWERWPAPAGPWGDIAGATAQTLNLAAAGNGDAGDQLRVRGRAHDGTAYSGWMTSAAVTVAAAAPNAPTALTMFAADGVTEIASGTHLDYAAAPRSWFAGAWFSDDDAGDTVGGQIYVAAEAAAAPDAGTTPTAESALVPQVGGGAAILIEILTLAAGRWKWWARTKSSQGTPSAWVAFSAAAWNVELNTAPALAAIAPQIAHENIDLDIPLAASDEDGGAGVALSAAAPLGWAAAIVDEVVVGAARTATLRLRAGISDARPAAYSVTARASDGFVNADRVFAVTVVNDAPTVAAVADAVAQRGEALEVPLVGGDTNGQGVDFRATAEQLEVRQGGVLIATPYWITVVQVTATTGKVVVAPPPGDDAEYEVSVRGKDGV